LDFVLQRGVLFLKGGVVTWCAESGSGLGLLAEELREPHFQIGDVLSLGIDSPTARSRTPAA